jgi:hypothetical protein
VALPAWEENMPKKSKIGELASAATKAEFGDKLSSYTSLTAREIEVLFPKKTDREELIELLRIVNSDADDKRKRAELTEKIGKVGGAVIKIVKKFALGL